MYDKYFKDLLKLYPSYASHLGDRSKDHRVEISISPQFIQRIERLLYKYDCALKQTTRHDLDVELLRFDIKETLEGLKFPFHLMPMTSTMNPILDFDFMERTVYPKNNVKARDARFKCYTKYVMQSIANMREGIKNGYVIPKRICVALIADLEKYLAHSKSKLSPAYATAIRHLITFLHETYLPKTTDTIGLCYLPNGKNMYKYMIREHTTITDMTPEYVYKFGLCEVRRIKAEMTSALKKTRYSSIQELKSDPMNFLQNGQDIIAAYKAIQEKIHHDLIPKFFSTSVKPYHIKPIPKVMQDNAPGAFYVESTPRRVGSFYVNIRDPKENPIYAMETLTIHEGEPGHHYQFQYMLEKGVPEHRIYGYNSTAFVEGWALYAESLSTSQDPLTNLGRLTYEMFRAVRCVVDPGIHYYGWSYEKAFAYMKRYIALSDSELEVELLRYICIPGQAVAYKIGENFFKQHRKNFSNIKEYHDSVLGNGILPLDLLARIAKPREDEHDHHQ
jgi:uncharacterized protein (DUF885 family)